MSDKSAITYESIWEIIEFYRVQPKVQDVQLEKIEEYLILMNAHFQNTYSEIDELQKSEEEINLIDVLDIFNSYLNVIEEEMEKIFQNYVSGLSPVEIHEEDSLHDLQTVELLRVMNGGNNDHFQLLASIDELDGLLYEEDFKIKYTDVVKNLISRINAGLIIKVDDLI